MTEAIGAGTSTREYKVKRFLAKPPKRAARLVLVVQGSEDDPEPLQLAEYEIEQVRPELAPDIIQALEDHAIETQRSVEARLAYVDGEGRPVTQQQLRREGPAITSSSELTSAAMKGDARSLVALANAQSLSLQNLYMRGMREVLQSAEQLSARNEEQSERLWRRVVALEKENEELRAAIAAAESLAAQEAPQPSESEQRALKLLETVGPMLLQRLMAPPTPQA